MHLLKSFKEALKNPYLQAASLLIICFAAFLFLHYAPFLSDPDSFYHIKISQMISDGKIVQDFPYLQASILKNNFVDHHLLYHAYLAPFVKYLSPVWGAKIGHLFLSCLVFLAVFVFLKKIKAKYAWLLTMSMFLSWAFIFRMMLIKAQPLSLMLIILSLYFLIKKKHIPLLITGFVFVWAYGGWFLLLILALAYIFIKAIDQTIAKNLQSFDRLKDFFKNIFDWGNAWIFLAPFAGLALGLIINPYFPKNLYFYYVQIIQIGFIHNKLISVGSEWYQFSARDLFTNIAIPLIILALPIIFNFAYFKKIDLKSKFLLFVSLLFLLATVKSKRNIEYFVPLAVLAAGSTFQSALSDQKIKSDWDLVLAKIKNIISFKLMGSLIILLFAFSMALNLINLQQKSKLIDINSMAGASFWIKNNAKGQTIYNLRWDRFPMLFYQNSDNNYVAGLDPTFTYAYGHQLLQKYQDIYRGKIDDQTAGIIKNDFKSDYIIADMIDKKFLTAIKGYPQFEVVYQDQEAIIYKIK